MLHLLQLQLDSHYFVEDEEEVEVPEEREPERDRKPEREVESPKEPVQQYYILMYFFEVQI
jgi:hypothetical protein